MALLSYAGTGRKLMNSQIVKMRVKITTYDSYEQMTKQTIEPYFRKLHLSLAQIEARHIQQFYSEKLKTVSANPVIHYHAVIYQTLKYAMKVDRPKKNDFQPVFLDASQLAKLFETVKGTKPELIVLVAAFYGLRRGEVPGLKWDAIDFERGIITIKRTVTTAMIDGKENIIEQDSAKTKSNLRTLPRVGSFRRCIEEVKTAQARNKEICDNRDRYAHDD